MERILFRPVKPLRINQAFAQNDACVSTDGKNRVITCDGNKPPVGFKSLYGAKGHLGVDLYATHSQPVYCALEGVVYKVDTDAKSGLDVRVQSTVDGQEYRHIYEHLLGYQPKVGDKVNAGDLIGWADNTGYSAGDHLHFQVEKYVSGKWVPIDPMDIMSTLYAQDIRSWKEILARGAELVADLLRKK